MLPVPLLRWGTHDGRPDVAQYGIDARAEEKQGDDADDRDQHEDQGVLGQTLAFFLRLK